MEKIGRKEVSKSKKEECKMRKPIVGETLYSLNVGNNARNRPQVLTPVVVTSVGRQYFTAGEGYRAVRYHISDWTEKTEYSPNSKIYESEQQWLDEKEDRELARQIGDAFEYGRNRREIPLAVLREIVALIDANTPAG